MTQLEPELVGLLDIRDILTAMGKVNQKTGQPLDDGRVGAIINRPDFPKPAQELRRGRLWHRADVIKWAEAWPQREGRPPRHR